MDDRITLGVLDAVHENEALTQRSLAQDLGIALGLTNAYLKRCVRKGLVKVKAVPANRYAYYLTPQGFTEKSRLTAEYLSHSFHFYGRAREQVGHCFHTAGKNGWHQVALCGAGDLAEIAMLVAMRHPVTVVGVVDADHGSFEFLGLPVAHNLTGLGEIDTALVTDLRSPQQTFERLCTEMPAERVLTPELLRVSRKPAASGGRAEP